MTFLKLENYDGQFSGCQGLGFGLLLPLGFNLRSVQASWNHLIVMVTGRDTNLSLEHRKQKSMCKTWPRPSEPCV